MGFVPLTDLLRPALAHGYAVPSFCAWNAESAALILRVAADLQAPVILMNGPAGEFPLLGPADMADIARALLVRYCVPATLHLDHGGSLEDVEQCLAAGYTSVMLDYSSRPFAENATALSKTVGLAHARGCSVEGELGHVGRADAVTGEGSDHSTLTDPAEAAALVEATGIDALAVSIGNAHGQYTRLPELDLDRLAAIRAAVSVPLVLHGGSGTPLEVLQRAIALGIAKVNVATELTAAVRGSLLEQWHAGRNLWTPLAQAEAMRAVVPVVEKWIRWSGAIGRA